MRSSGTSTSLTPRNEKSSFTRNLDGFSEVWRTIFPTAAVTAAWNKTSPACIPARFTRTACPGWRAATTHLTEPSGRLHASRERLSAKVEPALDCGSIPCRLQIVDEVLGVLAWRRLRKLRFRRSSPSKQPPKPGRQGELRTFSGAYFGRSEKTCCTIVSGAT